MIQIAAYKGRGRKYDRLIRWWTCSAYSHVEIVLSSSDGAFMGLSASPRDGGVRVKEISIKDGNWDFFSIDQNPVDVSDLIGARYDWTGIFLSQILPLEISAKGRFFCSELVAIHMGLPKPQTYSPHDIVQHIIGQT